MARISLKGFSAKHQAETGYLLYHRSLWLLCSVTLAQSAVEGKCSRVTRVKKFRTWQLAGSWNATQQQPNGQGTSHWGLMHMHNMGDPRTRTRDPFTCFITND